MINVNWKRLNEGLIISYEGWIRSFDHSPSIIVIHPYRRVIYTLGWMCSPETHSPFEKGDSQLSRVNRRFKRVNRPYVAVKYIQKIEREFHCSFVLLKFIVSELNSFSSRPRKMHLPLKLLKIENINSNDEFKNWSQTKIRINNNKKFFDWDLNQLRSWHQWECVN